MRCAARSDAFMQAEAQAPTLMQTTFLLLDFENVQPDDLAPLGGGPVKIKVFLGTHQTKVPVPLVRALQAFGPDV
jgi:hypothetical protein